MLSNLDATLPAVFAIMVFMMWNWWSVYLSGELKSGSDRRRQLTVMFGGLLWDGVFIVLGLVLFFKVIPYDLAAALNSGTEAYAIPSGPWYQFLASLVQNIGILAVIILGSFLFWSLPAMVGNTFMPIRSVFAWAFDRLLPEKLAEVNERTHSPVPAILLVMGLVTAMLAWSVLSTDFFTWLALGVEAGVVCVIIVAIAAILFPTRRPDLYQASPANVKFLGFPVFYLVGPLSILVMLFLVWLTVTYPGAGAGRQPGQPVADPRLHGDDRGHRPGALLRRQVRAPRPGDRHRPRLQGAAAGVTSEPQHERPGGGESILTLPGRFRAVDLRPGRAAARH